MRPIKKRTKNVPLNVATHLPITKGERIHFYQNSIPPCKGILRCVAGLLYHKQIIISSIIEEFMAFAGGGAVAFIDVGSFFKKLASTSLNARKQKRDNRKGYL